MEPQNLRAHGWHPEIKRSKTHPLSISWQRIRAAREERNGTIKKSLTVKFSDMNTYSFKMRTGAQCIAAILMSLGLVASTEAESFGIKFLGNTTDLVTGTAGVAPISGWNNITNTTVSSGTILSSDGLVSASWSLSGPGSANGWHSGTVSDGGNSSLLDGYMDVGTANSATMTISGLTGASYTVYVYTEADAKRPGNGGDWLPNYSVNNQTNFTAIVTGPFANFIQGGSVLANNNTYPPGITYGNYNEFDNVVPQGGTITVSAGLDTRTWRSPLNGIELVQAAVVHPIAITTQPFSQRILTNTPATFTVVATGTPIFYQWYKISGGVTNAIADATNLSFTTPLVQDGDTGTGYFVTLTNSLTNAVSAAAFVTAGHLIGPVQGFLESDQFAGFNSGLTALSTLYPTSPYLTTTPSKTEYLTSFNDTQSVANNSGERIFGWFTPSVTANYIFYVASDDQAALWLSTDSSPNNTFEIAQVQAWMYAEDWTLSQSSSAEATGGFGPTGEWRSDQFQLNGGPQAIAGAIFGSWSAYPGLNSDGSITLTAGTPYYIELDHWQGSGGQCAAVTYKIAGDPDPAYQSAPLLAGGKLSTQQALDGAAISISNQPVNVTVEQNNSASFSVTAGTYVVGAPMSAPPALEYQWQVKPSGGGSFTNIPLATGSAYSTPLLGLADNGNQYRVVLTTLNAQSNSAAATLSVQADLTAPKILEIGATAQTISITWNKLLDPATAGNAANYNISGGVTVTSVTVTNMAVGPYAAATVQLGVTGAVPGNNYKLTVNNVKDLSQLQTVSANTQVPFTTYNVFLDFNEGAASFAPAITNLNGLANLGLNSGINNGGGVTLSIPSGGSGGFVVNDPLAGATVNSFIASFKIFVGPFANNNNSNPGNYGNGFSVSFGPASSVFWGAPNHGDLGGGVNGAGTLAIGFTTIQGAAAITVYYGNAAVTTVPIADNLTLVNSQWADVTVRLNADGTVDVTHNGTLYVNHLALPGYTPVSSGNFMFGAASGLDWEQNVVDDIAILENVSLPPAVLTLKASGSNSTMTWTPAGGRLQTATSLTGSWSDLKLSQPITIPYTGTNAFFRVVVP